jgi:hypothetical protein
LSIVRITRSALLDRVASALESAGIPFFDAPPLGSVGVHAVHVARGLCEGPLLAIGLDFSFEAGKTHARGCPSLLAEERKLDRLTRWPGQFTASYRDRTILLDAASGTLSDPTLLSYAELLADREAGYRKAGATAYDLRKRGPSIGCPRMGLAEAEALVDAFPSGAASGIKHAGASRQSVETSVQAFLSAEVSFLEKLRSALRGGTIVPRVELERLIAEADYLWWGFPDRTRADKLAQDFLNRLVPQIEYWASRLRAFLH